MTYDELLNKVYESGLTVKEKPLLASDGRVKDKNIAIRQDIDTSSRKLCVLAEELGHYHTTVGNIIDLSKTENSRQEETARRWAYRYLLDFDKLYEAKLSGCSNIYETAEYVGLSEHFLKDAIEYLKARYGNNFITDKYRITIEPFDMEPLQASESDSAEIVSEIKKELPHEERKVISPSGPKSRKKHISLKGPTEEERRKVEDKIDYLEEIQQKSGVDRFEFWFDIAENEKLYGWL